MIKFINIIIFSVLVFSCSTKKDILYLQDIEQESIFTFDYIEHRIKPDDVLDIKIKTDSPESLRVFVSPENQINNNPNRESLIFKGFKVNKDGYINYPTLGNIFVLDKTAQELEQLFYNLITEKEILSDPSIQIRVINLHFTVLGEVTRPGKFFFDKNNMNILEALALAGDLKINGERRNIKLIRDVNNRNVIYSVDLTKKDLFIDKSFQIYSGDIIIVNPNTNRIKNAGIIGNSGTLLSLLSFILSSIIVISN